MSILWRDLHLVEWGWQYSMLKVFFVMGNASCCTKVNDDWKGALFLLGIVEWMAFLVTTFVTILVHSYK